MLKDLEKRGFGKGNVYEMADLQQWVDKDIYTLIETDETRGSFRGDNISIGFGPNYVPPAETPSGQ